MWLPVSRYEPIGNGNFMSMQMNAVKNIVIGLLILAEQAVCAFFYWAAANALEAKLGRGACLAVAVALLVPVVVLTILRRRQRTRILNGDS